jgi:hypothetical protein
MFGDREKGANKGEFRYPIHWDESQAGNRYRSTIRWTRSERNKGPVVILEQQAASWAEVDVIHLSQKCYRPAKEPRRNLELPAVTVEYIYGRRGGSYRWRTGQLGYRCPMCFEFGSFSSEQYLSLHLKMHHKSVTARFGHEVGTFL